MLEPVYMLAIDHRWQWEEWCDGHGVDRARIPQIKSLAAEAFLAARESSEVIRRSGALLVDLTYGRAAFDAAQAAGAFTGTPAERAGAFPLEWTAPFDDGLPGHFVKVLVRHRSDLALSVVSSQRRQLLELQHWCTSRGRPFVLEVLVSPAEGEQAGFDSQGRPPLLAAYIRDAYAAGMKPDYWKIEGMPDCAAVALVDEAIRAVQGPRQLILGKGAGMDQVRQWFGAAADWVRGRLSRDEAMRRILANYRQVIANWQEFHAL